MQQYLLVVRAVDPLRPRPRPRPPPRLRHQHPDSRLGQQSLLLAVSMAVAAAVYRNQHPPSFADPASYSRRHSIVASSMTATFAAVAASDSDQHQYQHQVQQQDNTMSGDDQYLTFFCRALYDYQTQDPSSLSFHRGDIIEVLTRLESGWWDGLLLDERGWFPSNYVERISDEEAEDAFAAAEAATTAPTANPNTVQEDMNSYTIANTPIAIATTAPNAGREANGINGHHRDSVLDMSHAMDPGSDVEHDWLDDPNRNRYLAPFASQQPRRQQQHARQPSNDFWVPEVGEDGKIFYYNTKTGQRSLDLPTDHDELTADSDSAANLGLGAQTRSRAGTTASLGLGVIEEHVVSPYGAPQAGYSASQAAYGYAQATYGSPQASYDATQAGFGAPRRSGTPPPWVRRLADDGMTYYYYNTADGSVSWTRPASPSSAQARTPVTQNGYGATIAAGATQNGSTSSMMRQMQQNELAAPQLNGHTAINGGGYVNGNQHTDGGDTIYASGPPPPSSTSISSSRLRSDSALSRTTADQSSLFTDTEDEDAYDKGLSLDNKRQQASSSSSHQPFESGGTLKANSSLHARLAAAKSSATGGVTGGPRFDLTTAERLARSLQQALAPPPPELVTDLCDTVRESISAVVQGVHALGHSRRPEDERQLDALVRAVVVNVRNLLYIAAVPTATIPSHLYASPGDGSSTSRGQSAAHALLKPAQRKVTATLSKLVLSGRAMQYDAGVVARSGSSSATATPGGRDPTANAAGSNGREHLLRDGPSRIEADADELDRAVSTFVLEVQRSHASHVDEAGRRHHGGGKRLKAVFRPAHLGLGLSGAGAAGSWKGFGWAALQNEDDTPQRRLDTKVFNEVKSMADMTEERFMQLTTALQRAGMHDSVYSYGRDVVGQMSYLLTVLNTVNVARHVDIDSFGSEAGPETEAYTQSVLSARNAIRLLEATSQSLYDDGASLLLVIESLPPAFISSPTQVRHSPLLGVADRQIDSALALLTSMRTNLGATLGALETLLAIGYDQENMARGQHKGSIEWRMSRLTIVDRSLIYDTIATIASGDVTQDTDDEDVLGLEHALSHPTGPSRMQAQRSQRSDPDQGRYGKHSRENPSMDTFMDNASSTLVSHRNSVDDGIGDDDGSEETFNAMDDFSAVDAKGRPSLDDLDEEAIKTKKGRGKGTKVEQLLGDGIPSAVLEQMNAHEKPWYLRPDYDESQILFEADGSVRGGTVTMLVQRLTAHESGVETGYMKTFLMTYKSFTTLNELFELLVQRFRIHPPDNLDAKQLEQWRNEKQRLIQIRVINTLKTMVQDEDVLEKEDLYILDRVMRFVEEVKYFTPSKQLHNVIERARAGESRTKTIFTSPHPAPTPIVPKNLRHLSFADVDASEMARQLTIMESNLYQKIRPIECLQRAREQKVDNDNIAIIIQTSNRIATWVADSVLDKADSRRRASVVKQFIIVADKCRALNNYSTMSAIVAGLNSTPIRRLKRTWEQVGNRAMSMLSTCEFTIDSSKNFNNYRQLLQQIIPPCVPFIGVFLTTLTFIQDGQPDKIQGDLINFRKRSKAAEVIQDIKRWQSTPYNLIPVQPILDFIDDSLRRYTDHASHSDRLWNLSLEREPREREDERMARLLQESGFL